MLVPVRSGQFRKDVKRVERRGKDLRKLRVLLELLLTGQELPRRYRDHALRGDWTGFRDAHVEPDWVLINRILDGELQLARTGTHADLFDL